MIQNTIVLVTMFIAVHCFTAVTIQMKIESRHVACVFDYGGEQRDNFTYERQLDFEGYTCDDFTVHIKVGSYWELPQTSSS